MNGRYHTFILASKRNGALYVGVTDDLPATVLDHKCNLVDGLTSRYPIHSLVYFEDFDSRAEALLRERVLKAMHRSWKLQLIESRNPDWRDLYQDLAAEALGERAVGNLAGRGSLREECAGPASPVTGDPPSSPGTANEPRHDAHGSAGARTLRRSPVPRS